MSEDRLGGRSQSTRIILTIVGLLCAPVVGVTVAIYFGMLFDFVGRGSSIDYAYMLNSAGSVGAVLGAYLGWPTAFLFGWPIHVGLLDRNATKLRHYVGLGAVIGVTLFLTVTLVTGAVRFALDPSFASLALTSTAAGALGGLTFWLIRRPDRDRVR